MIGIYKIISPSGKIYIGQSRNIDKRFQQYKRLNCAKQPRLYNSFIKYGIDKQEEYLKAGTMPWEKGFGEEPEENYGQFAYIDNGGRMRKDIMHTIPGDYGRIYDNLYETIINKKKKLISDEEALMLLEILTIGIKCPNPKIIDFK